MIRRREVFAALLVGALATSLVGCNSAGTSATSPIDLSPPQSPTNLHASTDASINRSWLVWDPSASASVSGYEIYSSDTPAGAGSLKGTVDAATTDYLLPIVGSTTTEYYRVRAIGTNAVPSAFTPTLTVERTGWQGGKPTTGPGRGTEGDF